MFCEDSHKIRSSITKENKDQNNYKNLFNLLKLIIFAMRASIFVMRASISVSVSGSQNVLVVA